MPSIPKINPVEERLSQLKSSMVFASLLGNHRDFAKSHKEFASLAVKNFEIAKNLQGPSANAPLFSKYGLRMFKVWFLEKIRIYTKDEKLLKRMAIENAAKTLAEKKQVPKDLNKYIKV